MAILVIIVYNNNNDDNNNNNRFRFRCFYLFIVDPETIL